MNNNLTDITIVLDRSGSMSGVQDATIKGLNEFLEAQRKEPGEARISLYQFDDVYEPVYEFKTLEEAPLLTTATFVPRGATALLDAIGRTIKALGERLANTPESDRPKNVLFVIITDGCENHSKEYRSRSQISDMISHQRDKYGWTFVFIGANQDALATAESFHIARNNALSYNASNIGTQTMAETLTKGTATLRRGPGGQSVGFYTAAEQALVQNTA